MATLNCRDCGEAINSDTRLSRCKKCGTLFPFACSVCGKSLRPPFPVMSDERYLAADSAPLCPDHFERQCPDCQKWFRADENPGFFLCPSCSATKKQSAPASASDGSVGALGVAEEEVAQRSKPAAGASNNMVLMVTVCVAVLIVLVVLISMFRGG